MRFIKMHKNSGWIIEKNSKYLCNIPIWFFVICVVVLT